MDHKGNVVQKYNQLYASCEPYWNAWTTIQTQAQKPITIAAVASTFLISCFLGMAGAYCAWLFHAACIAFVLLVVKFQPEKTETTSHEKVDIQWTYLINDLKTVEKFSKIYVYGLIFFGVPLSLLASTSDNILIIISICFFSFMKFVFPVIDKRIVLSRVEEISNTNETKGEEETSEEEEDDEVETIEIPHPSQEHRSLRLSVSGRALTTRNNPAYRSPALNSLTSSSVNNNPHAKISLSHVKRRDPLDFGPQVAVYNLRTESMKGYLYTKTKTAVCWEKYFYCLEGPAFYYFVNSNLTSVNLGTVDVDHFISATAVSIEDMIKCGVVCPQEHDPFLESESFFKLESLEPAETRYFKTTKQLPREKWIKSFAEHYATRALPSVKLDKSFSSSLQSQLSRESEENDIKALLKVKPIPKAATGTEQIDFSDKTRKLSKNVSADKLVEFCIKFGWMTKKGELAISATRKRFFVLHQTHRVLYYFQKETSSSASGYIHLWNGTTVTEQGETCFIIHDASNSRDYVIGTNSEEEMVSWVNAINSLLHHPVSHK